mmetsp:Transcript_8175/g.16155  ORF Transcript_8175/g.16155 Transcript_8175/m.16155 type:complete len:272 (+) Transcript_8175:3019-3834(+)
MLRVLARHLHDELQILAHVGAQQVVQALDGVLRVERAEKLDEELGLDHLGAHHDALEVVDVGVVLERALHKPGLLAEHGDTRLVVVREHLVCHNSVSNLRRRDQVHLEQARLQRPFLLLVALERVEQKGGGLLQAVVLHEDVGDDAVVERHAVGLHQLLRKLERARRVDTHDVGEQEAPVGRVVHLLAVEHDLLELARLHEALDHLGRGGGAQVDGERQLLVDHLDQVAQLLGALELVLRGPLLQQLVLALLDDRLGELDRLPRVELALLE